MNPAIGTFLAWLSILAAGLAIFTVCRWIVAACRWVYAWHVSRREHLTARDKVERRRHPTARSQFRSGVRP